MEEKHYRYNIFMPEGISQKYDHFKNYNAKNIILFEDYTIYGTKYYGMIVELIKEEKIYYATIQLCAQSEIIACDISCTKEEAIKRITEHDVSTFHTFPVKNCTAHNLILIIYRDYEAIKFYRYGQLERNRELYKTIGRILRIEGINDVLEDKPLKRNEVRENNGFCTIL